MDKKDQQEMDARLQECESNLRKLEGSFIRNVVACQGSQRGALNRMEKERLPYSINATAFDMREQSYYYGHDPETFISHLESNKRIEAQREKDKTFIGKYQKIIDQRPGGLREFIEKSRDEVRDDLTKLSPLFMREKYQETDYEKDRIRWWYEKGKRASVLDKEIDALKKHQQAILDGREVEGQRPRNEPPAPSAEKKVSNPQPKTSTYQFSDPEDAVVFGILFYSKKRGAISADEFEAFARKYQDN